MSKPTAWTPPGPVACGCEGCKVLRGCLTIERPHALVRDSATWADILGLNLQVAGDLELGSQKGRKL